jgi:hypothetical protein
MTLRTHSYAISSDRGYGSGAQFFRAPEKDAYASRVTKHGVAGHTAVDDSGSFLRSVSSIPIDSWTSSPFYPDAPNSHSFAVLGQMSVTNVALGALNLYKTAKETVKSHDIGDKKGFRLKLLELGTTFGQVGSGLISEGYSTATIGTMVSANPIWKSIATPLGLAGNITASALYVGSAISDLFSIDYDFEEKYEKKGGVDYMRRRLGLDEDALEKKALKDRSASDLAQAGIEYLKPFAKRNLKLLQKHGHDPKVKNEEEFIRTFLEADEIALAGENSLVGHLAEKKAEKMSRAIGEESVKKLTKLYEESEPEKAEVDKIVLSGLKKTNRMRYMKVAIAIVGLASMLALCIFTSGMPVLVAGILYSIVALSGMVLSISGLVQLKKAKEEAPGVWEKLIPCVGIVGTTFGIGLQIAIASVFTMGIAPIAIGIGVALVYFGLYGYHIYTIDKRRQEHGQYLLDEKKRDCSLEEFNYLCRYMSDNDLAYNVSPDSLRDEDRAAILRFMRDEKAKGKNWREMLLYAGQQRKREVEREYVDELWEKYRDRVKLAS